MDTIPYIRVFLDNIEWAPETSAWRKCKDRVVRPSGSQIAFNRWMRKHPMVLRGAGFWETKDVVVTGYVLKHDARIFRPVFHFFRNKQLQGVLNTIKDRIGNQTGGGKFMTRLRRNLARRAMLGLQLPVSIIFHIGTFI